MDRSRVRLVAINRLAGLFLVTVALVSAAGCPALLATGVYVWEGGNLLPAECEALKSQRVVVMCRPPASNEYSHASASRNLSQRVSEELVKHVKKIAEEYRVSVRNHRRVAVEHLKEAEKKKEITADEAKHGFDRVQKITDDFIGRIDKIVKAKEDEVMVI